MSLKINEGGSSMITKVESATEYSTYDMYYEVDGKSNVKRLVRDAVKAFKSVEPSKFSLEFATMTDDGNNIIDTCIGINAFLKQVAHYVEDENIEYIPNFEIYRYSSSVWQGERDFELEDVFSIRLHQLTTV